jgi:hypothetical protein
VNSGGRGSTTLFATLPAASSDGRYPDRPPALDHSTARGTGLLVTQGSATPDLPDSHTRYPHSAMPRRTSARNASANPVAPAPVLATLKPDGGPLDTLQANLTLLRRQWKWAAFHQFFYTFEHLFAMPEISITVRTFLKDPMRDNFNALRWFQDIEDDLTRSTSFVLPRVIIRLIHTLSHDKKTKLVLEFLI